MLTQMERQPLRHLRLGKAGVPVGVLVALGGLMMLMMTGLDLIGPAIAAIALGLGIVFVSGYYWACGNGACTPPDA